MEIKSKHFLLLFTLHFSHVLKLQPKTLKCKPMADLQFARLENLLQTVQLTFGFLRKAVRSTSRQSAKMLSLISKIFVFLIYKKKHFPNFHKNDGFMMQIRLILQVVDKAGELVYPSPFMALNKIKPALRPVISRSNQQTLRTATAADRSPLGISLTERFKVQRDGARVCARPLSVAGAPTAPIDINTF